MRSSGAQIINHLVRVDERDGEKLCIVAEHTERREQKIVGNEGEKVDYSNEQP